MKSPPFAARFLYRDRAHSSEMGPWNILTTALSSLECADCVVAEFNHQDRGTFLWKWEECLPEDFDYPLRKT
jgi:hypothetical protein